MKFKKTALNTIQFSILSLRSPLFSRQRCEARDQTLSLSLERCTRHKPARSFCRETEPVKHKGRLFQAGFSPE